MYVIAFYILYFYHLFLIVDTLYNFIHYATYPIKYLTNLKFK